MKSEMVYGWAILSGLACLPIVGPIPLIVVAVASVAVHNLFAPKR